MDESRRIRAEGSVFHDGEDSQNEVFDDEYPANSEIYRRDPEIDLPQEYNEPDEE